MGRKAGSLAAVIATLASVLAAMAPASAMPTPSYPAPPSVPVLVATTNAMLQPRDVPAGLRPKGSAFSVSYAIPSGAQDPQPVCVYPGGAIGLSADDAIGYEAGYGQFAQNVWVYPSSMRARKVWSTTRSHLAADCHGSSTQDGNTTTVTSGPLTGAAGGWWVRSAVSGGSSQGTYLVAIPVRDSIQLLFLDSNANDTTPGQRARIDSLARQLAVRLAKAAELPVTQTALRTAAERAMLTPADIPPALPITKPSRGGTSLFVSDIPSSGSFLGCDVDLPEGLGNFVTGFGGQGDVIADPGVVTQQLAVYAEPAAAQKAWAILSKAVLACHSQNGGALNQTTSVSRSSSGTSALSFGGIPGLWTRTFETFPAAQGDFSSKRYSVFLLAGTSIQTVTYYETADGVKQLPLDQEAVNALAEQLANRWVAELTGAF